jgi:Amt family ammonium transporter
MNSKLNTVLKTAMIVALLCLAANPAVCAIAPTHTPSPAELAKRIADLEAYVHNAAPSADGALGNTSGPGHNGWMMTSAALVLSMTLPGLALFYGGLVRAKNVLSVLAQCLGITGLVTVLWWAFGYSLVFGKNFNSGILGGSEFFFFRGVDSLPNTDYAFWVSQNVFAMFQMMFAIITPALIIGAIAERMKFSAVLLFVGFWMFLVYFPLAHMVWGVNGRMNGVFNPDASIKAIDFAGGTVVHMSSGWSALVLCLILGPRIGFRKVSMPPHSMVLCMIGTGMLWVGWYGFNAGSALGADGIAANAFTTTTLATAVASLSWCLLEWTVRGEPSVLGLCSGAVAGLVVITPACGFITPSAAVLVGVFAGSVPFFACTKIKNMFGYDDALDTFGVHGVGGTLGALLTGFFATSVVNGNLDQNLKGIVGRTLWIEQLKAIGITLVLATVASAVIGLSIKALHGLRPAPDEEEEGLDLTEHGEPGYHHE